MRNDTTVLVTGGAGFIGSHLCDALLQRGQMVICIDNFESGSAENVSHLRRNERFRLIEHDVVDPLPALPAVHRIFNLACPASPAQYQRDPVHTMKTSVVGALNLLELARASGARILQASTSEVYGDPEIHPQPEEYWGHVNPIGPRACYDEGKRAAETLFCDFRRSYGLAIKIARIFNTYGPRMMLDDGRIVSNFITQALRCEPLSVYGDGRQTRSFCYIEDMVRALIALMDSPEDVTGPVNLGNPEEVPVLEVAERIIAATGSSSTIHFHPLPIDDPRRRRPEIERARSLLDWAPQVRLSMGLLRTIEDFAQRLRQPATVAFAWRPPGTRALAHRRNGIAAV
jgi:UDP-glucuronate decarboxylase